MVADLGPSLGGRVREGNREGAGIESVHPSQRAAARSLGLGQWQALRFVILPQAVRRVIPPLLNDFIALMKDTSLVSIVSLYELTGAMQLALNSDANWRPYKIEGYMFIALVYFVFCFAMSRYSMRLERRLMYSSIPTSSITSITLRRLRIALAYANDGG